MLEVLEAAEAQVAQLTDNPKGSLYVAAPLGVGRRLIAPHVPGFLKQYPEVQIRLRGKNVEENPHVKMGAYHALDLTLDRKFELHKQCWDAIFLERLQEAVDRHVPESRAHAVKVHFAGNQVALGPAGRSGPASGALGGRAGQSGVCPARICAGGRHHVCVQFCR